MKTLKELKSSNHELRERIRKLQWAVLGNIVVIVLMFLIIAHLIKS